MTRVAGTVLPLTPVAEAADGLPLAEILLTALELP
jgi:hypothetical protein